MNKKGQTLVEVVVALSILAIVFAGTVTLIVNVVNLTLASRNKTEAVAIAQKKLAETIETSRGSCSRKILTNTQKEDCEKDNPLYQCRIVSESTGVNNNIFEPDSDGNFTKYTVLVSWTHNYYGDYEYAISQVVKK